jgi:hypothetical protein
MASEYDKPVDGDFYDSVYMSLNDAQQQHHGDGSASASTTTTALAAASAGGVKGRASFSVGRTAELATFEGAASAGKRLHVAVVSGRAALVDSILAERWSGQSPVDERDEYGLLPVFLAVRYGYAEIAASLIDAGARVDSKLEVCVMVCVRVCVCMCD